MTPLIHKWARILPYPGDGCEFCNPQLAEELAKEQR